MVSVHNLFTCTPLEAPSYLLVLCYLPNILDRLQPVQLRENSHDKLNCELKKRLFFKICLHDSDFVTTGIESKLSMGLIQPLNIKPPHIMLKLSHEHQGFTFEPDATKLEDMLEHHSGGKVSKALRMALEQGEIKSVES